MHTIKPTAYLFALLGIEPVPVDPIVNGYHVGKTECCCWYATKTGAARGQSFKTKRAAVAYAKGN